MDRETTYDVAIIGAGITGLTAAYLLKKSGYNVKILEKTNHIGGVIETAEKNGFVFEKGPNTGVLSNPELIRLFDSLGDDCNPETANSSAKKRLILKNGKWQAIPGGLTSAITTPLFSLKDKFRILGEPFRKPGTNPHETLADLVKRRMGKSFLDYAVDPFIAGIYAGDPNELIPKYALPKLYNLEQDYGSFIKGAMKKKKEPKSEIEKRATKEVFSVKGGLENLTKSIANSLGKENIELNCENVRIKPCKIGFEIQPSKEKSPIFAKRAITTTASKALADILPFVEQNLMDQITNLQYAKIAQAAVGFKKWTGKDINAFGGLIPSKEKQKYLGILFPSSIFSNRAPEKGALLSVFMGGMRNPDVFDMDDQAIRHIALEAIGNTLGEKATPDVFEIMRYKYAIPQYTITSKERFEAISTIEKQYPGLILAGNIRNGIGMADRVKQAYLIHDQITSCNNAKKQ